MTKTIYLIRHGETDYNRKGIVQGRGVDTDLNETGRRQARLFYQAYWDVPFDKVYTSTLKRTHQTVQPFLEKGIAWEQLPGLDELDWGSNEGRATSAESELSVHEIAAKWASGDYDAAFDGGESAREVALRQEEALQYILSHKEENNILICMHGRAIRILMCRLTGKPLSEMDSFPHQNLSLYKLACNGDSFEVLNTNDISHLINE